MMTTISIKDANTKLHTVETTPTRDIDCAESIESDAARASQERCCRDATIITIVPRSPIPHER